MKEMILLIFLIIVFQTNGLNIINNTLQWCQINEKTIQCFDQERYEREYILNNKQCIQDIFRIENENTIIFNKGISSKKTIIDCDIQNNFIFQFNLKNENNNSTLKGVSSLGGITGCKITECYGYCYNKGYCAIFF